MEKEKRCLPLHVYVISQNNREINLLLYIRSPKRAPICVHVHLRFSPTSTLQACDAAVRQLPHCHELRCLPSTQLHAARRKIPAIQTNKRKKAEELLLSLNTSIQLN